MNNPDIIYDLKQLSAYCPALRVPTLRDYIKSGDLPCFKVKGKILVRKSEFDTWLEDYRVNRAKEINAIVNDVLTSLKSS